MAEGKEVEGEEAEGKETEGKEVEGEEEVQLDRDIEVLREGMPERGVWLAGEHTAPFVALGTVTGAWWSGEGVGRRILEGYGLGGGVEDGEEEKRGKGVNGVGG